MKHFLMAAGWAYLLLSTMPAYAQNSTSRVFESGTSLNKLCAEFLASRRQGGHITLQHGYEAGICQGFVIGALDAISVEQSSNDPRFARLCLPPHFDKVDVTEIVANYVERRPEERHIAAYTLVRRAMAQAYPCK
jgi:hypothetical protein